MEWSLASLGKFLSPAWSSDNRMPFGTQSLAELGERPATGFEAAIGHAMGSMASLPERALEASNRMYDTGEYDPGPILEAAMLPMGTGAIAGVPMRMGEMALGAGPIRAYHGSPHDFDRFDLSKIGSGEGAQAFGHGLYFTDKEVIARGYRDKLSPGDWSKADDVASSFLGMYDRPTAVKMLRDSVADPTMHKNALPETYARAADLIEGSQAIKSPGHMYEVNINAKPKDLLDFDALYPDLPKAVQGRLRDSGLIPNLEKWNEVDGALLLGKPEAGFGAKVSTSPTSDGYYRYSSRTPGSSFNAAARSLDEAKANASSGLNSDSSLANLYGEGILPLANAMFGSPAKASAAMRDAGIPGIKYLDGQSRGAGTGTRNYVMFDDKLIDILRKYGIAGLPAGGLAALGGAANDQNGF